MFRYMNYAYAVYREKSFTRAAEKLYISQPSLSLTIKKLEAALGCPVFERCGKEITLTHAGERYIAAVEEIMRIQNSFESELDDMLNLKKGKVKVGSTIFISSYLLPDILRRFSEKYPFVETEIVVERSSALRELLDMGELDLVIDNSFSASEENEKIPVMQEKILIGVPEGFKINSRLYDMQMSEEDIKRGSKNIPRVNIKELSEEKFILLRHGNKMRKIADSIFSEGGISPTVSMEFDQLMTAVSYAESGFGICFLTDTILKYAKGCRNLCCYVPETAFSERTLYVMYKKSKYLSRAAKAFIDEVCI